MKFSTATTSAVLLANASLMTVNAFGPSSSFTQRQYAPQQQTQTTRQTTTRLSLINMIDPILASAAIESTSIVASSGIAELFGSVGSLALLGSVGFGVFSGMKDPDWSYEYKVGNDAFSGDDDLALLGESPVSVLEKVEEETKVVAEPKAVAKPEPVVSKPKPVKSKPAAAAAVTAKPTIKANRPSKELLESTEKAKAIVQKKGVQETKERLSSKSSSSSTPSTPDAEAKEAKATPTTEVAETKKPGGKRRFAKGVSLIVAAGAVAVARNVVKAYFGSGML